MSECNNRLHLCQRRAGMLEYAALIGRRRTIFAVAGLTVALLGLAGLVLLAQNRLARCAAVPFLTRELLPNAALQPGQQPHLPAGWSAAAPGVELQGSQRKGFDYNGDGRALQLIGIGNVVQTPPIAVQSGTVYCFAGRALTDSAKQSATRLRLIFDWRDAQNRSLGKNMTDWQPVVLWRQAAPPDDWSAIGGAFGAPAGATTLRILLQPASDDRVYLDAMHVQQTTDDRRPTTDDWPAPQPAVDRRSSVVSSPGPTATAPQHRSHSTGRRRWAGSSTHDRWTTRMPATIGNCALCVCARA